MQTVRATFVGLVLVAFALVAITPAAALRFGPLVQEFTGSGAGSKRVFRIENEGETPVAVQIEMKHRQVAPDGKETLSDAEDDFIVFPPQMVLLPGEGRVVRVQWLGDPAPKQQLTYRIIVEQLPVTFEQEKPAEGPQLRLLVRYEGSIYISPSGAKGNVKVAGEPRKGPEGAQQLFLRFSNTGTSYRVMTDLELTLRSKVDASSVVLKSDRLSRVSGENVLAGRERHFAIPWPDGLTVGAIDVSAKMSSSR